MEWWTQGYTFHTDMKVLELGAYDATLGYDWLKSHNPMVCHWEYKTLEFREEGRDVHLRDIVNTELSISELPAEQFLKWYKENDICALVVVQCTSEHSDATVPAEVQQVIEEFSDVFESPQELPPHREYDYTVPLLPNSTPVNARPYKIFSTP